MGLGSARAASASRIDGISDQNLPYWGGSGNGPLAGLSANAWLGGARPHLRYARYVVQWDVMSRRTREPYRHYYEAFADWYREVHALGLSADVAFGLYTGAPPASADAYRSAIEELLSAFPVPSIEAFNEPNGTANLSADAAAHFFNQAYGYCERHGCEAIAGDFLDTAGAASYALQYKRALSPTEYPRERDPPNWGLHPYIAVNRGGGEAQAIRRELPARDSLWITEVGAYYCEAPDDMDGFGEAGQAANAWRLVNVVIPALDPVHVFYYELSYKDGELTPCDQYSDTALYVGIGAGRGPRPASCWGASAPPWLTPFGARVLTPNNLAFVAQIAILLCYRRRLTKRVRPCRRGPPPGRGRRRRRSPG